MFAGLPKCQELVSVSVLAKFRIYISELVALLKQKKKGMRRASILTENFLAILYCYFLGEVSLWVCTVNFV